MSVAGRRGGAAAGTRRRFARRLAVGCALLAVSSGLPGCVRRTMTLRTDPPGARAIVNDEEVGRTPLTIDFTWYGDYDLAFYLEGYETLRTHYRVRTPWYQVYPLDFFSEVLWPFEIHDHHVLPVYRLEPQRLPEAEELVERSDRMREQTVGRRR